MVVIDNNSVKIAREKTGSVKKYQLSVDVFMNADKYLVDNEYAIVVDASGNELFILRMVVTTYMHSYNYTGEVDMRLLEKYDCIVMHDCNEFAIELYLSALNNWHGKRIVFVGSNWNYFLDILPQYDGVEYYFDEELTDSALAEIISGMKPLIIMYGIPHLEKVDRYYSNILFYDEVMLFTFMFSDCRCLGSRNPDKRFLVIDPRYGNLGLFGFFNMAITYAKYALAKGFIPILRFKNEHGSMSIYQDFRGDDFWEKFFNQPEGYSINEVMESRNVYFAPEAYNASIISYIMEEVCAGIKLSWPYGVINPKLETYVEEKGQRFLPYPDDTLGVLARGTDYNNGGVENHPIHASKEMLKEKIDEILDETGLKYIYLATEDSGYSSFFKEAYGDRIFFTDQERYFTRKGEMLADMHRNKEKKREGFILGAEYYLSIYLLSKCTSLLASGRCTGVDQALKMNGGKYRVVFVF